MAAQSSHKQSMGPSGFGDAGKSYDGLARQGTARRCASAVSSDKEMTPAGGMTNRSDAPNTNRSDKDAGGELKGA